MLLFYPVVFYDEKLVCSISTSTTNSTGGDDVTTSMLHAVTFAPTAFHLCCSAAHHGCFAGVGKLLWDILATLGQSSKDSDSDDVAASSLLLLGHPGVGQPSPAPHPTALSCMTHK